MKNANKILNLLTVFMAVIGMCAAVLVCFIVIYTNINGNFSPKDSNATTENVSVTQTSIHALNENETIVCENDIATDSSQSVDPANRHSTVDLNISLPDNNNSENLTGIENNFNTYNNEAQQNTADTYVLNTDSQKIHYPNCEYVKKIAPQNYSTSSLSVNELNDQGYTTCGICFK